MLPTRRLAAIALAAWVAAPAASAPGAERPEASAERSAPGAERSAPSEFEATLLGLADRALAGDDLDTAYDRYERVLDANPRSVPALVGLGRVALRRGGAAEAARRFEAAVAIDPGAAGAHRGLAVLAHARGETEAARRQLEAALAAAPQDPVIHQLRLEWTGLAPAPAPADLEAALALARAHPYDPRVQVALARHALAAGDRTAARAALETALRTADLAPEAAPEAVALLGRLDGGERHFVPVHLRADESVRDRPGWAFELRVAWAYASATLAPVLSTVFVPVSIRPFSTARLRPDLGSIQAAMTAAGPQPEAGIVAGFTRRESPRTRSAHRKGQARYLGRELVVRLDPDEPDGRTLAHEILHLYGAIHLSDEVTSLMNPFGGGLVLDAYNAQIVEVTASRRFTAAGIEHDVLDHVDRAALADALLAAIGVNVHFRNAGVREALEAARTSRFDAALRARKAMAQDRDLAPVARLVAGLLVGLDRPGEAVLMMEEAADLYGRRTPEGRQAAEEAARWRRFYRARLGL